MDCRDTDKETGVAKSNSQSCSACCALAPAAFASAEGTFERSLKVTGPVMLEVETGSGNIEVHSGGAGSVHVVGHVKANRWWGSENEQEKVRRIQANPPIQQSGNDIRIGHIDDPELRRNISISYQITVPADAQVRGKTGSGNATVEGVQAEISAWSRLRRARSAPRRVRAAWSCVESAGRWRPLPAVETFAPTAILRARGWCTPVREGCN
jgi:hypothetical protein